MTASPTSISIPPPPALEPPEEPTNTLALLLPNQALFEPSILALLKSHYGLFGEIIHWAPVKGFGRVIIAFATNEDAERTKREGDWLKLDLTPNILSGDNGVEEQNQEVNMMQDTTNEGEKSFKEGVQSEYFTPKSTRKRRSQILKSNELILRLYNLPPTPINPDPSSFHLAPPTLPHNFLISPPGSPPEGWEPILEEGPNTSILAEDLQRALESLQLNGINRKKGGKEIILSEGPITVQVEDTTKLIEQGDDDQEEEEEEEDYSSDKWEIKEKLDNNINKEIWNIPNQGNFSSIQSIDKQIDLGGLNGFISGSNTPSGKIKIAPTARPPM
ncbi:uncharacterized protein I206_106399 [Kwoniella pini CBS 10737]|uniref:Calcineurin-binding protein n=1 Tax=Kwoniella pini CBS 10737 TaxID=1296096 RepID=A0A1B9HU72_9TREE|nr:uncharacterized protein I206_07203 [Kwoniella pini CBS 10737]OCF46816.1 hypothetical protein I206_07203 [Kwoniella pini CBS 10737]